jgi:DNA replication licensing factor MCM6
MSSLFDAVIAADNIPDSSLTSDAASLKSRPRGSSRGLPSEGAPHSDAAQQYPDEEVVGARGNVRKARQPPPGDVPKVVDEIGETMVQQFEDFLES